MSRVVKTLMKAASGANAAVYRASGGKLFGKAQGMPILLLTVPGRKTGAPHTTPVVFLDDGGTYVVAGSAGGQPAEPQWFRNLRAADRCEVEIGRRRQAVTVRVAEGEERERLWHRLVSVAPGFDKYQAKLERKIPLAVLTPTS